ncbi:MAG TPA: hypothetical protein VHW26_00370 [Solirubrobacteraceae bacterium]|jgi:hypothetical protein|nr:hypothetical protein [Solirubrobacteraceae bacterium]
METTEDLHVQLGDPLPSGLAALDDSERADLARAVADARTQQAVDTEAAIADALRRLPPGLRAAARVILRG